MDNLARGYITSGVYNSTRTPQHIQNQIIKLYCDSHDLRYILSRAEYWMNGNTQSQLWAALEEGYPHIVLFSLWQLPAIFRERIRIYKHCFEKQIVLHFAVERLKIDPGCNFASEVEMIIQSDTLLSQPDYHNYMRTLKELIQ